METYKIEFKPEVGELVYSGTEYIKGMIDKIGNDFRMAEKCDVLIELKPDDKGDFEVSAYLHVPRHVFVSKKKGDNLFIAAKTAFDDLSKQIGDLKFRMMKDALKSKAFMFI
jgi:ribosome-associated translation inhibitor RaiA